MTNYQKGILWGLNEKEFNIPFLREQDPNFIHGVAKAKNLIHRYQKAKFAHRCRILKSDMKGKRDFIW